MKNSNPNQLSLNLVCEPRPNLKLKSPNPFIISEKVKRILFKRGYSHIFNYPDYQYFKSMAAEVPAIERAHYIADLFIENTSEKSDFDQYVN